MYTVCASTLAKSKLLVDRLGGGVEGAWRGVAVLWRTARPALCIQSLHNMSRCEHVYRRRSPSSLQLQQDENELSDEGPLEITGGASGVQPFSPTGVHVAWTTGQVYSHMGMLECDAEIDVRSFYMDTCTVYSRYVDLFSDFTAIDDHTMVTHGARSAVTRQDHGLSPSWAGLIGYHFENTIFGLLRSVTHQKPRKW